AGGSLPVWLVLISLKSRTLASQRELAEAVGIQGATLSHHLDSMESAGLVTRRRDPANRRLHLVELTPAGDALFLRLRDAATAFDRRLRAGLSEGDVAQLEALLTRLRDNGSRGCPGLGKLPPEPVAQACLARLGHRDDAASFPGGD